MITTIKPNDGRGLELRASFFHSVKKDIRLDGFGIKYVKSGVEEYCLNGKKLTLNCGDVLIFNGSFEGEVSVETNEETVGYCLDIHAENSLKPNVHSGNTFCYLFEKNRIPVQKIFANKLADLQGEGKVQSFIESVLNAASQTVDAIEGLKQKQELKKFATQKEILSKLFEARELLLTAENVQISDIASEVGLSDFHFIRLYKSAFGISPYEDFSQMRWKRCLRELNHGIPINQLALDFGFADIYSFSRSFKKRFGAAPTKFAILNSEF
ncbi:MAG: helix-turn-helix domain-containing protein [Flavobacteriales bacterium]